MNQLDTEVAGLESPPSIALPKLRMNADGHDYARKTGKALVSKRNPRCLLTPFITKNTPTLGCYLDPGEDRSGPTKTDLSLSRKRVPGR